MHMDDQAVKKMGDLTAGWIAFIDDPTVPANQKLGLLREKLITARDTFRWKPKPKG